MGQIMNHNGAYWRDERYEERRQAYDFMQPMMILKSPKLQTLPLMLRSMVSDRGTDYGAMMLASTCAVLPLLVAFLCASKYFMSGLTAGAVKE